MPRANGSSAVSSPSTTSWRTSARRPRATRAADAASARASGRRLATARALAGFAARMAPATRARERAVMRTRVSTPRFGCKKHLRVAPARADRRRGGWPVAALPSGGRRCDRFGVEEGCPLLLVLRFRDGLVVVNLNLVAIK